MISNKPHVRDYNLDINIIFILDYTGYLNMRFLYEGRKIVCYCFYLSGNSIVTLNICFVFVRSAGETISSRSINAI